jgi:hypothetical protein
MTAVKLKGNYTYPRFHASRRLHVTQPVSLRRVENKACNIEPSELAGVTLR